MSSIIKVGKVQSSTGQDAIDIANDGSISGLTTNNIQPTSGQPLTIKDEGGTASITVATNGEATFAENIKITANKGINFSNYGSEDSNSATTVSSNLLDDYEEGLWSPVFTGGSSTGTYSMSYIVARYTKIGRVVHVSCSAFNVTESSAGSGEIRITGLPFTVENTTNSRANVGTLELDNFTFTGSPHCSAQAGHTYINFKTSTTGTGDTVLQTGARDSNSSDFAFNLTYTV